MDESAQYFELLGKIDQGKHSFLDLLEFMEMHTDPETEPIYEWLIGQDEPTVMRFVQLWDGDWEMFEDTWCKLMDMIEDEEIEKSPVA